LHQFGVESDGELEKIPPTNWKTRRAYDLWYETVTSDDRALPKGGVHLPMLAVGLKLVRQFVVDVRANAENEQHDDADGDGSRGRDLSGDSENDEGDESEKEFESPPPDGRSHPGATL